VLVVDGHVPVGVESSTFAGGDRTEVGHDKVGDADIALFVVEPTDRIDARPIVGQFRLDRRGNQSPPELARRLVGSVHPMQEREVDRVQVALITLQEVAVLEVLAGGPAFRGSAQELIVGYQRRLAGSHVREDQAPGFMARVGPVADLLVKAAPMRLPRLLQTAAFLIVKPAVVDAAQPAILEPAVAQVRASVAAM
jgi:hypothetical protein